MKEYSKKQVAEQIQNAGIVPVFYHAEINTCKEVIKACYKGGITVFEYVNRGNAAAANFPVLQSYVQENFPDMLFGIGSVITKNQAQDYVDLDADFIVSPILDEEVAAVCHEKDKLWIPGCGTLSEMARAEKIGAQIVKAFPGNVLGPEFIKAVLGPMPWLKIMPTGGVKPTAESLKEWYEAGAACLGMGSQLIKKEILINKSYDELVLLIKETFRLINKIKNK